MYPAANYPKSQTAHIAKQISYAARLALERNVDRV
jgi:hypothetical protein